MTVVFDDEKIEALRELHAYYEKAYSPENEGNLVEYPLLLHPRSMQDWLEDPISLKNRFSQFCLTSGRLLDRGFADLSQSPTFQAMLQQCPEVLETIIYFEPLDEKYKAGAIYIQGADAIVVNYGGGENDDNNSHKTTQQFAPTDLHIVFILHELRHAYHALNSRINTVTTSQSAEEAMASSFIQEAEVFTFQATVCWELLELGSPEFWNKFCDHSPEIAEAFMNSVIDNPNNLYSGIAQTEAFNAFFECQRKVDFYSSDMVSKVKGDLVTPEITKRSKHRDSDHNWKLDPLYLETEDETAYADCSAEFSDATSTDCKKPKSPEDESSLDNNAFGLMPYLDDNGDIVQRDDYLKTEDIPTTVLPYVHKVPGATLIAFEQATIESIIRQEKRRNTHEPNPLSAF